MNNELASATEADGSGIRTNYVTDWTAASLIAALLLTIALYKSAA